MRRSRRREDNIFGTAFVDVVTCGLGGVFILMIIVAVLKGESPRSSLTLKTVIGRLARDLPVPRGGFLEVTWEQHETCDSMCFDPDLASHVTIVEPIDTNKGSLRATYTSADGDLRWCAAAKVKIEVEWSLLTATLRKSGKCSLEPGQRICLDRSRWQAVVDCGGLYGR